MDQPMINSIALGFLSLFMSGLFAVWFRTSGRREKQLDAIIFRLDRIETQNAIVDTKMIPLWAKAQKQLSDDLHHPHAKDQEMDGLLEKLEALDIDEQETERLKNLLMMRAMDANISPAERRAATVMPYIMDIVLEKQKE
jgi:hypothetical protein